MASPRQAAFVKSGITKVKELTQTLNELDPKLAPTPEDGSLDCDRAFQLFCSFSGDIVRTAHALGVKPVDILRAADRLGWHKKLEPIFALQKSGKPGDVERSLSRSLNFVQAHRLRVILERVLDKLYALSPEELFELSMATTTKTAKDGTVTETRMLNTKAFADIASSLERVHAMLYQALADSVSERVKRKDSADESMSASNLHALIARAMSGTDSASPAGQLLEEQIDEANSSQDCEGEANSSQDCEPSTD
jgi:hypothetical protein